MTDGPQRGYARPLALLTVRLRESRALPVALAVYLGVLALLLATFSVVTEDVLDGGELVRVDDPVSRFLIAHRTPWLTPVMRIVTDLGSALVVVPLVLLVGVVARRARGSWRPLAFVSLVVIGATLTSTVIKVLVARPRPATGALVHALGYAFPSGHSTTSAAAWLSAAVVVGSLLRSTLARILVGVVAVLVVGLVGLSRIYLGVHAPTDVLGGWALGTAWLIGTLAVGRLVRRRAVGPARPSSEPRQLP
ncbi:MAG TPA: phosphatase PAP2 family protein [Blastococcus sp.]|jgi:undecaprenyl-diphosphatase|nr:phosphatase PAP2 family protein [Blastococcus sp.]